MSAFGNLPIKIAAGVPSAPEFNSITLYNDTNVLTMMRADSSTIQFAPANPDYVTLSNQTAVLSNSFSLGSLGAGILRSAPVAGVGGLVAMNIPIVSGTAMTGGTITIHSDAITTSSNVVVTSSNSAGPLVIVSVNNGNFVVLSSSSSTCTVFYMIQN